MPDPEPGPPTPRAPDLREAVKTSIDKMEWLTESDQALVALALRHAEEIEKAIDRAEELNDLYRDFAGESGQDAAWKRLDKLAAMCDVTKVVGWLGPQLQGLVRDLGGTPKARQEMKRDRPIGGRLAQIRRDAAAREDDA